jgi:hypothetical protein
MGNGFAEAIRLFAEYARTNFGSVSTTTTT